MPDKEKRSAQSAAKPVSMRIDENDRGLIDSAAAVAGKSRTDFVVDSARRAAVETLLDARAFRLDEAQTAELDALFAQPPAPIEKLRQLLAVKAPWES